MLRFLHRNTAVSNPHRATQKPNGGLRVIIQHGILSNVLVVRSGNGLHHQWQIAAFCSCLCQTTSSKCLDVERAKAREAYGNGIQDAACPSEKAFAECLGTLVSYHQ